ncbi:MAG TPA: XTP/dITP diphosphatase [Pseudogracilibacillus sp.]|nr:XTP/dITP diphosphatase [Pseudogracilibacillus sp.]
MRELIIATHNKGKVKEFKQLLNDLPIQIYSLHDFPEVDEIEETGSTFHENAQLKAETIARQFQKSVLADDSGLVVDALNGAPGVYSARYAGEHATDDDNIAKLLQSLQQTADADRTAHFICVLAFAQPEKETSFHEGKCFGRIIKETKGEQGFGYDPVFVPRDYDKTFAELSSDVKNKLSHRSQALKAFKAYLKEE